MSLPRVLLTRRIPEAGVALVRGRVELDVWEDELPPPSEVLRQRARGVDGLWVLLTDRVDHGLLDAAGARLKVVSSMSVGVDHIDVAACTRRGIPVGHTPDVLTESTADLAFALILAAARRLPEAAALVKDGGWKTWSPTLLLGLELSGATLGIVGFGRIGQAVARRALGFGMRVLVTTPRQVVDPTVTQVPLEQLLEQGDLVSLHCPLTPGTRHLIDAAALGRMKSSAYLVNTARGPVVDPKALHHALSTHRIAGAALDVTDPEPMSKDDPLLALPNCLVVPHIASATVQTRDRMAVKSAQNLLAGLEGGPLPWTVNPDAKKGTGYFSGPEK